MVVSIPCTPQVVDAVHEPADTNAQGGQGVAEQEGDATVVELLGAVPTQLAALVEAGAQ